MYLGIDVGGTHTDAVLYYAGQVRATAKVKTQTQTLAKSIKHVLLALQQNATPQHWQAIKRITLGTTLGLNALVQNATQPVGLFVTAGPGLDPLDFAQNLGPYVHRVVGGLNHRGQEVSPLCLDTVAPTAVAWVKKGVRHFAVIGKFSVHNPAHEQAIASELATVAGIELQNITLGHSLSGALNFPRRMAAAYMNGAIQDVQRHFLQAVQETCTELSLHVPIYLLKADGGAIAWEYAHRYPLYSVLSGPAASVMGGMALQQKHAELALQNSNDLFLLDMGGTTTDIALYVDGIPVLDREGMRLPVQNHLCKTPLRSLATLSLGLGGDSLLRVNTKTGTTQIDVGPQRFGDAVAFGGMQPTLLDALNVCALLEKEKIFNALAKTDGTEKCGELQKKVGSEKQHSFETWKSDEVFESTKECHEPCGAGDMNASLKALEQLAKTTEYTAEVLAQKAVEKACAFVLEGMHTLLQRFAGHPVYTLAELLEEYTVQPQHALLVGAPAKLFARWLAPYLQAHATISVFVPSHYALANALGAAVTLPTAHVEFFGDTLQGVWHIPTLHLQGKLDKKCNLDTAIALASQALREHFPRETENTEEQIIDVVQAQSFAILDDYGRGGRDIRVICQWRPTIL